LHLHTGLLHTSLGLYTSLGLSAATDSNTEK